MSWLAHSYLTILNPRQDYFFYDSPLLGRQTYNNAFHPNGIALLHTVAQVGPTLLPAVDQLIYIVKSYPD